MATPNVASITLSLPKTALYILCIAFGTALGISVWFVLAPAIPNQAEKVAFILTTSGGSLLAHFCFARSISSWPSFEFGDLKRTIGWSILFTIFGSIAIRIAEVHWLDILSHSSTIHRVAPFGKDTYASVLDYAVESPKYFFIGNCIAAPIAEEIIFRSGIYRILKGRFSTLSAASLSSIIFALAHPSVAVFLPIVLLGLLSCWVYEKTADIRGSIFFHAGYNFLLMVQTLFLRA